MWKWWRMKKILSYVSDYRWGLYWRLDSLVTLTHDSWLRLIIVPSLISTLYKSLQHMLNLFSLSLAISWEQILRMEILQLHQPSLLFTDPCTTDCWPVTALFKVKVILRLTVSQSVLVSYPIWGIWPGICLLVLILRKLQSCLCGRPLWREVRSVICRSVLCVMSLSQLYTIYLQNI
jgi:hypothetical protein